MSRVRPGVSVRVDKACADEFDNTPTSTPLTDKVEGTLGTAWAIVIGPDWGPGPKPVKNEAPFEQNIEMIESLQKNRT